MVKMMALIDSIYKSIKENGGCSINLDGQTPSRGYMVSGYKNHELIIPEAELTKKVIFRYITKRLSILRQPKHYFGAWVADGYIYLDISINQNSLDVAIKKATECSEIAIWDVEKGETIYV